MYLDWKGLVRRHLFLPKPVLSFLHMFQTRNTRRPTPLPSPKPQTPFLPFPPPNIFQGDHSKHSTFIIFPHMIQEQRSYAYQFLNGEYARIKIKMQPKSLMLQVPLDWQINKIKCLLVKMLPRLQFDMFVFKHDNEQLPGDETLKRVIELDTDEECINREYYILTFAKLNCKEHHFERYYSGKIHTLISSLEKSPFQPILHPGYYQMKRLNQLSLEGKGELVTNFNQLQQMQNVIQEQRREIENQGAGLLGLGLGNEGGGNQGRGILQWAGVGLIRIIQLLSILTILRYVCYNSDINVFISLGLVLIAYFLIEYLKKRNQNMRKGTVSSQPELTQKLQVTEASTLEKIFYSVLIIVVQRGCLCIQFFIAYILALFPNWTVESHKEWFHDICASVDRKITIWNLKITPLVPEKPQENVADPVDPAPAPESNEESLKKQHEQ